MTDNYEKVELQDVVRVDTYMNTQNIEQDIAGRDNTDIGLNLNYDTLTNSVVDSIGNMNVEALDH